MTLHTVGPVDMGEDERAIGKAYQLNLTLVYAAIPFGVAYFADLKWVIAASAAVLIVQGHEAGGRLHDLCIRLRRTNILLRDRISN
jgi:hypothetical protein